MNHCKRFHLAPLLFCFLIPQPFLFAQSLDEAGDVVIHREIKRAESYFHGLFPFFASLYDPATGGFYENPTERRNRPNPPRLESTCRVVLNLSGAGEPALRTLSEGARQRIADYIRSFYDPATGHFDDPHEKRQIDERRGRALNYATNALNALGFPFDGSSLKSTTSSSNPYSGTPPGNSTNEDYSVAASDDSSEKSYLWNEEEFLPWARQVVQTYSWNAWQIGSIFSAQRPFIRRLDPEKQEMAKALFIDFLNSENDPETGFWWAEPDFYRSISAVMKVSEVYREFDERLPNTSILMETILETVKEDPPPSITFFRNVMTVLWEISKDIEIPSEQLGYLCSMYADLMGRFSHASGGFTRFTDEEPSTDACSHAVFTRRLIYRITNLERPDIPSTVYFLHSVVEAEEGSEHSQYH